MHVLLCTTTVFAQGAKQPFPRTNLSEFFKSWQSNTGLTCELDPHWIGIVKTTYHRNIGRFKRDEAPPNNLRLTHVMVTEGTQKQPKLFILRPRLTSDGVFVGTPTEDIATFTNRLGHPKGLEITNLTTLERSLGPDHGVYDSNGTRSWVFVTQESTNELRYLGVLARPSQPPRRDGENIEMLQITEGSLRPATANSVIELEMFKTGTRLEEEYQAQLDQSRQVYPFPLRALVAAQQAPGDSHLIHYREALNEVRRKPSPELFKQFAQWLHERSRMISVMLDTLIFDNEYSSLQLDKWQEPQRKIAIKALVEALPDVKTSIELNNLIVLIFRARGGGDLKLEIPGTNAAIDITAETSPEGKIIRNRIASRNISAEYLEAAGRKCREALKEKYTDLN